MARRAKILVTFSAEAHADEKSGTGSYSTKRGTFGVEKFHVTYLCFHDPCNNELLLLRSYE